MSRDPMVTRSVLPVKCHLICKSYTFQDKHVSIMLCTLLTYCKYCMKRDTMVTRSVLPLKIHLICTSNALNNHICIIMGHDSYKHSLYSLIFLLHYFGLLLNIYDWWLLQRNMSSNHPCLEHCFPHSHNTVY
jgi:hypothetical protein